MITEEMYLLSKKVIESYESKQLNIPVVIGRFTSLEECENEAISFTKDKLKVVSGLLSEDYKIGYKEGVEHYLASKNDL
ncbi:MAG TPA: hypothetical protein PLD87_13165 [Bacteroidia bacterium]|nr:hypothetical protein [Bacteroidia bacterium]